jgi:hypothetical protein
VLSLLLIVAPLVNPDAPVEPTLLPLTTARSRGCGRFHSHVKPGLSMLIREHLSQDGQTLKLQWNEIEPTFDVCDSLKPVRLAEARLRIENICIAETAHNHFKVMYFLVRKYGWGPWSRPEHMR